MHPATKYKYSDYSIWFTVITAALICCFFTWHDPASVNLLGGDSRYYYYYLQSTFINPQAVTYDWLSDATPLTHHPVGLSVLWTPFFLMGLAVAYLFHFPLTGLSLPFQAAISVAALFYFTVGLVYLKKLLRLNSISDKVTALVMPLIFFGTNLLHYALNESGMSHVYSFCLITAFMYHGQRFTMENGRKHLLYAFALLGLILLVRANNGLVIFTVFFWFSNKTQCVAFFKRLFRNPVFYAGLSLLLFIILLQPLVWYIKENSLFVNRYAPYGFYWTRPQLISMLFGFNAGFFIYTPLCLLLLLGLVFTYGENRFLFFSISFFLLLLFYFFSAYSAYTYYDGLGIRVLVDYYALFALLGAKLFAALQARKVLYGVGTVAALLLVGINMVYCYQGSVNILQRSGMNYNKWKYIFLKTGNEYRECLGGSNDLTPYAEQAPVASLNANAPLQQPFDFARKDFGLALSFDSIGFISNRIQLKINLGRKENFANSSRDALVCAMLEDKKKKHKSYVQFRLNETPSKSCCPEAEYHYAANMEADFKADDKLSVYLWNVKQQPFEINKFAIEVYNYAYQTN